LFSCRAAELSARGGAIPELSRHLAVSVADVLTATECAAYVAALYRARSEWAADFAGEQFCLGRAFYAHFEEDRCREYFAEAASSNARVERVLPGLQQRLLGLVRDFTGATCFARRGFCGPGVHIFPAGEKVAREGGVVHFDTEGLVEHHAKKRKGALSFVLMLGLPASGGGLRLWDATYAGREVASERQLAAPPVEAAYGVGSALVFDSYRLHQIQPFSGRRDRISATVHAAEIDTGRWETWF